MRRVKLDSEDYSSFTSYFLQITREQRGNKCRIVNLEKGSSTQSGWLKLQLRSALQQLAHSSDISENTALEILQIMQVETIEETQRFHSLLR